MVLLLTVGSLRSATLPFLGSAGSQQLASPIAGMFANGNGYTLVAQDGTLYPFG